jgi:predicted alpha/beta superfamily hydrolase
MKLVIIFLFALCSAVTGFTQQSPAYDFKSASTGITYSITVKAPPGFDSSKAYKVLYVPDGSLKMGNYILGTNKNWAATVPKDVVIVAIAHKGEHTIQRQRDFIPSDAGGYHTPQFAQAHKFYLFLKNELLPHIAKKVPHVKMKAFTGHSFSGLFCLYTTLQPDKLFDRHFAISPSVWANYGEINKIEKQYAAADKTLAANLHIWAGTLEVFNKVLSSATSYYNTVKDRKYQGCRIEFETIAWANHISILKPAIDKVMKALE